MARILTRGECFMLAQDEVKKGGSAERALVYATLAACEQSVEWAGQAAGRKRDEADRAVLDAEVAEAMEATQS